MVPTPWNIATASTVEPSGCFRVEIAMGPAGETALGGNQAPHAMPGRYVHT